MILGWEILYSHPDTGLKCPQGTNGQQWHWDMEGGWLAQREEDQWWQWKPEGVYRKTRKEAPFSFSLFVLFLKYSSHLAYLLFMDCIFSIYFNTLKYLYCPLNWVCRETSQAEEHIVREAIIKSVAEYFYICIWTR